MFNWLNPWILVPTLLVSPISQVLLFAYIGRSAGVGNDEFYLIGNALNYAAIPCLFAMGATIGGERYSQTLGIILTTPARRIPLFLGRSLPAIVNGWGVAMFGLLFGGLLLGVTIPWSAWPAIALVTAVTSASCTGLGLVICAISLRVRESATLGNVLFLVLLVFCGVNVSLDELSGWMAAVGNVLPLTHGIQAAREVAAGGSLGDVSGLVLRELGVGAVFVVVGLSMLSALERLSRSRATLDLI
ncbi:ABC transporter permease [Nocardioides sp. InS609-2]|uniref:ABC transporter permease n=1 Tax=Nocardioides sp. InS609-2 TaxID=2760705 RepID=UPI0020BF6882|nr:ABC transporter permease [Nocardioides sp. InS609-2]